MMPCSDCGNDTYICDCEKLAARLHIPIEEAIKRIREDNNYGRIQEYASRQPRQRRNK